MIKPNFILILLIVVVSLVKTEQVTNSNNNKKSQTQVASSIAVNGLKPLPLKIHKRELTEQQNESSNKNPIETLEKKFDTDLLKYIELQKYNRDLITNELIHRTNSKNGREEREYDEDDEDDDEYDEDDGEFEMIDGDDDDQEEYYDQYMKLKKNKAKRSSPLSLSSSSSSSLLPSSSSSINSNSLNTNSNERKKQLPLEKYKKLLINLVKQKNSLYNTMPIDTETFAKYMNDFYLSHHASKSNSGIVRPFKGSVMPTKDSRELNTAYLIQKMKRAACGNLNGNPMHKWICW